MKYDFTTVLDRRGRDSIAADVIPWDVQVDEGFDTIPMWIADMAFPVAPPVLDAMRRRLDFPSLGYYAMSEEYFDSILSWPSALLRKPALPGKPAWRLVSRAVS